MAGKSFSTSPQVNAFPATWNLQLPTSESLPTPVVKMFFSAVTLSVLVKVFPEPEASDSPASVWLLPRTHCLQLRQVQNVFQAWDTLLTGVSVLVDGAALEALSWSFSTTETPLRRGLLVLGSTSTAQGCCKCKMLQHHIIWHRKLPALSRSPHSPQGKYMTPSSKGRWPSGGRLSVAAALRLWAERAGVVSD